MSVSVSGKTRKGPWEKGRGSSGENRKKNGNRYYLAQKKEMYVVLVIATYT